MPVLVPVRIDKNGAITAMLEPEQVPVALDDALSLARGAGDGVVVHRSCPSPEDKHALAKRLAEMFLREVG